MILVRLLLAIFVLFFLVGCSDKNHQLFTKNRKPFISKGFYTVKRYKIQPYDRISILVFEYPELSTNKEFDKLGIQVASNGTALLPLLGRIKVAGYTKEALEEKLYRLYGEYLEKRPAVKVEILNQKAYVLGEVRNPGAVEMTKFKALTPIKAIVQRGGLTDYAKRDRVLVIRGTKDNYKVAVLDFTDMSQFNDNNFLLQPEDIIYVAHNRSKDFNLPLNGLEPTFSLIRAIFNTAAMYKMVE